LEVVVEFVMGETWKSFVLQASVLSQTLNKEEELK
jgi:hypothetical protein